jgi:hypothetical protein
VRHGEKWDFKGQTHSVKTALRVPYRFKVTTNRAETYWQTETLLIGYAGGDRDGGLPEFGSNIDARSSDEAQQARGSRGSPQSSAVEVSNNGTLVIRLGDDVAVQALETFLRLANEVYTESLSIDGTPRANDLNYVLSEEDELSIKRLEIGTPNLIELIGNLDGLGEVAEYFGMILTGGVLGAKTYGDLLKKRAEAKLLGARARRFDLVTDEKLLAMSRIVAPQPEPKPRPAPRRSRRASNRGSEGTGGTNPPPQAT